MMKSISKNHIVLLITCSFLLLFRNTFAQVSKYQRIDKVGKSRFNYVYKKGKKYKYKKDKSIKVVFSDKKNNVAYLDAYGQEKGKPQNFLTPYFVLNSKNGFYELVEADSALIGKPKGIFSFLFSKKNHFSDTKSLKYAGWLPHNSLIHSNVSLTDAENNQPLKYKIGFGIKPLFELSRYLNKDSLKVYKDPLLKIKSNKVLLTNQVVYPYKYDVTKRAVFVSTKPVLKDTINQISGWIPAHFIFPIGQNKVFKFNNKFYLSHISEKNDTINLHHRNIYSKYFYDNSYNTLSDQDSLASVSIPLYVWNHRENKIINVDGNDILISEVDRLKEESKTINFHFIFNQTNKKNIKPLISSLQSVWIFLSQQPNIQLSFSAICTGKKSFILPKTKSFAQWLDFMQKVSEGKQAGIQKGNALNTEQAIRKTLSHKSNVNKNFENNFFIIVGNTEPIDLYNQTNLLKKMAVKSSTLLFVQTNNEINDAYQNYILRAKESMSLLGRYYNLFMRKFTVDNNLIVSNNSLKNITSDTDNIYVYDAPKNSRFNGGIIFPKINEELSPLSLNVAVDSILINIQKNNHKLISSLDDYKSKLGVLRSKPSRVLQQFFYNDKLSDSLKLSEIDRNNINEVFYNDFIINKEITDSLELGYILSKDELISLIENYRMLLPYFSNGVSKKERKLLKKMYKNQINGINNSFKRKVLSKRKSTIGELFYYKTGFPVTETILNEIRIKKIKRNWIEKKYHFSDIYLKLLDRLNFLEEKFLNNQLERTKDNRYYIPKKILL